MAKETTEKNAATKQGSFPACCKHLADKMAGCGPMMEKMMSRFGARNQDAGCCKRSERPENG
ncbi:MAG: hypothetical protein JRG85_02415 [Deltaproteobacteria bacterium]|nr:hypothetical protein [Deltaproteobacteria bacterium]